MITNIKSDNKLTMISQMVNDSKFQVLQFDKLRGIGNIDKVKNIEILNDNNINLKQVRIVLENSGVKIEDDALSYLRGSIDIVNSTKGIAGISKKFLANKINYEVIERNIYTGTGEIFLEPSLNNYGLIELQDEEIIVQDGMFVACEDSLNVKTFQIEDAECIYDGNIVKYETSISGSGIVVLELPMPQTEIFKCKLYKDIIKTDGDIIALRSGNINREIEKITSVDNKVTYLDVYSGTGEVWILPTKNIYENLDNNDKTFTY